MNPSRIDRPREATKEPAAGAPNHDLPWGGWPVTLTPEGEVAMSDIQHIDVDSDEFLDAPKALRDHVKKIQSRLAERDLELASLKGKVTETALGSVLGEFKNPERVKRDLLAEGVDPLNTEAVQSWLAQNGDDYAKGGTSTPSSPEASQAAADHQQVQAAQALNRPSDMTAIEAAHAELPKDATPEQVIEAYRKHGI